MASSVQLARQALGRELQAGEKMLAEKLEAIFSTNMHDPGQVAAKLNENKVPRPSGSTEAWNEISLIEELRIINHSLDAAYAEQGSTLGVE